MISRRVRNIVSRLQSFGMKERPPELARDGTALQYSRLTAREYQILAFACSGDSSSQIAHRLYLNEDCVQRCLQAIADKMGLSECTVLVAYARSHNLCETANS